MKNRKTSARLTYIVCLIIAVILAVLLFIAPQLFRLYLMGLRKISSVDATNRIFKAFCFCFYPCEVFAGIAIYSLLKLLGNIMKDNTFISENVKYLHILSWSCIDVALITFVGGFFYFPFFIVAAAAGFIGLMLRTVKNVMQSAVELKKDAELTI